MPHLRNRYLFKDLTKLLKFSPLVGLFGHRQVGKTTLASLLGKDYYSLDIRTVYDAISSDPLGFLNRAEKFPTVLDECQTIPELFPALKEFVRTNKKPGSFLLTGSVRFTSRKAIRESLTGRIIFSELLPMGVAEIYGYPLPESLLQIAKGNFIFGKTRESRIPKPSCVEEYLISGGLPGIFSVRNNTLRIQKISTQLETILDRDMRLIISTSLSFSTIRSVLTYIAQHQGENLNLSEIQRATRVTRPTLQKLLLAFEGLFLIRSVRCEGGVGGRSFYLEDQAEASYLVGARTDSLYDLQRFLYANLRLQTHYRPALNSEIFKYETKGGALVPLCFRFNQGVVGIIPLNEENPNRGAVASATSFLRKYKHSKVIFVNRGKQIKVISPALSSVPAHILIAH